MNFFCQTALRFMLLAICLASVPVQGAQRSAPPKIDSFYADPSGQPTPGTEVTFTVEGTPKGKVSVRIDGVQRVINLKEVEGGVYEGSYTVRTRDKVGSNATARASLKARGRTTTSELAFAAAPPRVAAAPAPAPPPAPTVAPQPKIDRFAVAPIARIEPGVDLRFTLAGTPGAKASVAIEGVAKEVPLREVKSGQYEGSYTIRRLDNFPAAVNVIGTLESGGQSVRTRLDQSLLVDARPPVLRNQSPRDGETLPPGPLSISATIDDSGGLGVDPKSVRIALDGKDVTPNATVTPQFLTFRGDPGPGAHRVEVIARDLAGNTMRHGWSFTVAAQPIAAVLPLQIVSHAANAFIPSGPTEVRGRTAPGAQIDVKVTQTASVAGLFGVNQEVLNQSVKADGNGNFSFRFQPPISVPGSRYEIAMKARAGQASRDTQLVLFQQK